MIDHARIKECADILAMAINPAENEIVEIEGHKINAHELTPMFFKMFRLMAKKHEARTEEILMYIVESVHYCTMITDEKPEVIYTTPEDLELMRSGYSETKFKV